MFALVFRELIVLMAGLMIVWAVWKQIRKKGRRDAIQDCLDSIDETLELAKKTPNVDPKRLIAAREKLAKLQKQGSKNG